MYIYTLEYYLKIKEKFYKNLITKLQDENEKYILNNKNIEIYNQHNRHDKIFRMLLNNKQEAVEFINENIDVGEKLTEDKIEKYETRYITKKYEDRETDIIYKIKNKEIFILIEHQTKEDKTMALRILEYSIEIIRSRELAHEINIKEGKIPQIIPIVLYTGEREWKAKTNIKEMQIEYEKIKEINTIAGYNLIDIRDKEKALKSKSLIAKMSVLERMKTAEEIIEMLEKIEENTKGEEERRLLANVVRYMIGNKLDTDMEKIIKKLEGKGEVKKMHAVEVLRKDRERIRIESLKEGIEKGKIEGKKEGKKEGILYVAKKMLKEGLDEEFISKITGLDKKKFM